MTDVPWMDRWHAHASCKADGVGFEETQKSPEKHKDLQGVTHNTTHSPSAVAHAARVLFLVQRIATMPPELLATLYALFSRPPGKP